MRRRIFLFVSLIAPILASRPAIASSDRDYLLATASPGGTFYPVGVALAALVKATLQKSHGIALTTATTAGSAQNVRLLESGEAQFAILQGLFGSDARSGLGVFAESGPSGAVRSVTGLWPNVEQFVMRAEFRQSGTIEDLSALKGRPVVLGSLGSGTLASSITLLGNLGLQAEQAFQLLHMGYGPAADALQRGEVAAIALPAGLPTKALARLKSEMGQDAVILEFTEDQARRADGGRNLWQPYVLPADTYPDQAADIRTIAQPNFLAVREDVPEEDVYLITQALFDNLPLLHQMHAATQSMSPETALAGLPMPLHPGAARYFREAGVPIPDHLLDR